MLLVVFFLCNLVRAPQQHFFFQVGLCLHEKCSIVTHSTQLVGRTLNLFIWLATISLSFTSLLERTSSVLLIFEPIIEATLFEYCLVWVVGHPSTSPHFILSGLAQMEPKFPQGLKWVTCRSYFSTLHLYLCTL